MNYRQQQSGYILMLTLMMVALMTFVATYLISKTTGYTPAMRTFVDREKATMLALGGIQVALSQLAVYPQQKQGEQPQQISKDQEAVTLLKKILPSLNRWQSFALKKERDGITGILQLCITSEQGKLDINKIYDFKKQQFISPDGKVDASKTMQKLFERISELTGGENLFKSFEKFLKDRQYKLDDVTQLLTIKEFDVFKRRVWYEPPATKKGDTGKQEKRAVYLTDIFTVWSHKSTLEPWLLSDSLCAVLNFKGADSQPIETENIQAVLKQFKLQTVWATEWDKVLKLLYEKEYKVIPSGIEAYFSPTFEATMFSVLSYGKVGTITQKLLAIVERRTAKTSKEQVPVSVKIKKIYWL